MAENTNTSIWDQVQETDPNYTKGFKRSGGFKGTSTNATFLARRATEIFGPMGIGWGLDIIDEKYVEGGELAGADARTVIHVVRARLWYILPGTDERGEITQFGQTTFVGSNQYGIYTDEEAPKKSLTDAMVKCLSLLGFAADIFLGLYDDNKYVTDLREKYGTNGAQNNEKKTNNNEPSPDPKAIADAKTHKKIWRAGCLAYAYDKNNPDWNQVGEHLCGILDPLGIDMSRLRSKKLTNEEVGRVLQAIEVAQKGRKP